MKIEVAHVSGLTPPDTVDLGSIRLPKSFWITATGDDLPFDVALVITVDETGAACTEFTAKSKGVPITSTNIREVPISRIQRRGLELAGQQIIRDADTAVGATGPLTLHSPEVLSEAVHRRRRWRLTDDKLQEIAQCYLANVSKLRPSGQVGPTEAVVEEFDVPRSTADRWVSEARKRGFLPPYRGGVSE